MKKRFLGGRVRVVMSSLGATLTMLVCFAAMSHAQDAGWTLTRPNGNAIDFNAVHFVDSKRGWIAGDAGLIMRTTDEGATWAIQSLPIKDTISDIHFRTKEDGCLVAGSLILCTIDGGTSWTETARFTPANFGGLAPELLSVSFADKRRGIAVGSLSRRDAVLDSLALLTDDGGATWKRIVVPTKAELIDVDFAGDEHGLIVGAGGTVLSTRDGGRTWVAQRSGTQSVLYGVESRSERMGWVVGERGTILRTVDGGETWSPVRSPVRTSLLSVRFVNSDDGFIAGRGGVILRSGDGGRTWLRQETRTTDNLYALHIAKKIGWAVGGKGSLLRYER